MDLEEFFRQVDRLRQTAAGSADAAAAIEELKQLAPATTSDQTLQYLLTTDAATYDLLQRQALGALKTVYADSITPDSVEAARREPPVDKRVAGYVPGDRASGVRGGGRVHPAQPGARSGPDPRPAESCHGPGGAGDRHRPRGRHSGSKGRHPHSSGPDRVQGARADGLPLGLGGLAGRVPARAARDGDLLAASLPFQQGERLSQQHEARSGLAPAGGHRSGALADHRATLALHHPGRRPRHDRSGHPERAKRASPGRADIAQHRPADRLGYALRHRGARRRRPLALPGVSGEPEGRAHGSGFRHHGHRRPHHLQRRDVHRELCLAPPCSRRPGALQTESLPGR